MLRLKQYFSFICNVILHGRVIIITLGHDNFIFIPPFSPTIYVSVTHDRCGCLFITIFLFSSLFGFLQLLVLLNHYFGWLFCLHVGRVCAYY